jgi:hypothetical protein
MEMKRIRAPFGRGLDGIEVVWPEYTGSAATPARAARRPELWEQRFEAFAGETVLDDPPRRRAGTALQAARYLVVRLALNAGVEPLPGCNPEIERNAVLEYLHTVPAEMPERRWLRAVLNSIGAGALTPATVSRLSAAAAAAARTGCVHGAFALYRVAWQIACAQQWHAAAGRVARSIARAAARGRGTRSERLWVRRARVHERRAAAASRE